jgi:uncharacterized protein YpuA (DUF1002 family)
LECCPIRGRDTEVTIVDAKAMEDVINSLSKEEEEEKENLEDVIRETLKRDKTTKENIEKVIKAFRNFSEYSRLLQSLEEEKAALRRIREELQLMMYAMYLTAIPDNKFHHA